tara:strand:- start:47118 stop:48650 length:1533 start_codon:yes stop_codon:yes gene_type:complete
MAQAQILVIGDIMLDRYFYGSVSRISPEAPVPVLQVAREGRMLGGAGNVIRNLDGLGIKSKVIAITGHDQEGEIVANMLESLDHFTSSDQNLIKTSRATTVKSRFVAQGQQLLRADEEDKTPVSGALESQIIAAIKANLPGCQAVILSDYDKGVLTTNIIQQTLQLCRDAGIKTLVDPKGNDYSIYKGCYVVTPNRDELSRATNNAPTLEEEDVVNASNLLMQQSGIENIVATRSEDGMTIVQGAQNDQPTRPVHIPTQALEVYDVSGAGDTVIATIAAGLAVGANLVDAARIANIAGGIVVAKTGTAPVSASEIIEHIEKYGESDKSIQINNDHTSTKISSVAQIHDWGSAKKQIEKWQRVGLKIGLTNGCFDLLHPGHVQYLHEARMLCDRLIVALNHDQSVRLLKGPDRPIQSEESRASVIGALAAVDMVVLFGAEEEGEDNTATALITHLQPDIYVKGGDYKLEDVPEVPAVKSYGGEALILALVDGYSTTNHINKIKKHSAVNKG